MTELEKIVQNIADNHSAEKSELVRILADASINDFLFKTADAVRKKYVGDEVHLRGLIEFSNICKCSCKYCGLRKDNLNTNRYRMDVEEILSLAKKAKEYN